MMLQAQNAANLMSSVAVVPPALRVEEIFAAVRPRLEMVLRHFRIPFADAEDLVQEALMHFLRKQAQIHEPEQWLVGAVRKECLMYWRRHRRRLEVSLDAVVEATADRYLVEGSGGLKFFGLSKIRLWSGFFKSISSASSKWSNVDCGSLSLIHETCSPFSLTCF